MLAGLHFVGRTQKIPRERADLGERSLTRVTNCHLLYQFDMGIQGLDRARRRVMLWERSMQEGRAEAITMRLTGCSGWVGIELVLRDRIERLLCLARVEVEGQRGRGLCLRVLQGVGRVL